MVEVDSVFTRFFFIVLGQEAHSMTLQDTQKVAFWPKLHSDYYCRWVSDCLMWICVGFCAWVWSGELWRGRVWYNMRSLDGYFHFGIIYGVVHYFF